MSTRLEQIFTRLKTAIEEIKANGDNKNGKIDTFNETNKVAELLAGAQQEVGDFFNAEQEKLDSQNLTKAQYDEKNKEFLHQRSAAMATLDMLEWALADTSLYHGYDLEDCSLKRIDGLKHIYKDGGFDVIRKSFEDGSYSAETYDNEGKFKGIKLYKNDKEVYSDPEYVAKKLGLKRNGGAGFLSKLFTRSDIPEGDYYSDYSIYRWNEKEHLFEYKDIRINPENCIEHFPSYQSKYEAIHGRPFDPGFGKDIDFIIENLDK